MILPMTLGSAMPLPSLFFNCERSYCAIIIPQNHRKVNIDGWDRSSYTKIMNITSRSERAVKKSTLLTISLPKREQERLLRLALQYGLSLSEFLQRILEKISSEIPEESFDDYENPKELKASFSRAMRDWRAGRVRANL